MTEIKGGSDLGAAVETIARPAGDGWLLTGGKYFASNASAELAVVAARPVGAAAGVRGLALFLVPRYRHDGELNYFIRRLKDKIGTRSVPTGKVSTRRVGRIKRVTLASKYDDHGNMGLNVTSTHNAQTRSYRTETSTKESFTKTG